MTNLPLTRSLSPYLCPKQRGLNIECESCEVFTSNVIVGDTMKAHCVCVCVCIYIYGVCVCVCVCVREREREIELELEFVSFIKRPILTYGTRVYMWCLLPKKGYSYIEAQSLYV